MGLAMLAVPTLLVSFDMFVLLLALPHMTTELGLSSTDQLWIVDIYGFMVAGFLITMGTLGDRIGRRKLLLIGAAAFGVASVVAAYSTSAGMLIAARAVLGVAGATLGPSSLSLISNMFRDDKERGVAIGIWAACFSVGAIVGPIIGGVMLQHFWWGSVFLLGVPAMVVLLAGGRAFLPEYRNEGAGRVDLASVALSLAAILPFIWGVKELAKHGWGAAPVISVVAGLVIGYLFLRRQRVLAHPLMDLSLFKSRIFNSTLTSMLLVSAVTGTSILFITGYYQSVAGMDPLTAGLGLLPGMTGGIISVLVAPHLAGRFKTSHLIAGGLLITSAGLLVLTQVSATAGPVGLMIGFALCSLGGGPLLTLGTGLVVGFVPPEKAGTASSLTQVANEFGYAIGIATLGTIGTLVYRTQIADTLPAGLPAQGAAAAGESVAGATAVAGSLPEQIGSALLGVAREAFTNGLHVVAAVGGILLIGVAIMNAIVLKDLPSPGQSQPPAPPEAPEEAAPTPEPVAAREG
ncbi:MFS transporter [Sphaerisporangium sp. TRM90804]|uniref:MFS transporter n=1 Tax=Sphaerisporangium sp. TRM90804 TaxID=3031113 RepID=UPI00244A317D|nr:MFS transporter [Sphaerisporangium sp. TRM90804]MDH2424520.1 MFS transporter [Sphaerisporangium sp. TRM90804]